MAVTKLVWWKALMRDNPWLFQFGQPKAGTDSTWDGKTGCTHTVIQALVLGWKGTRLTHDEISLKCGYPDEEQVRDRRGLKGSQVQAGMTALHMPYKNAYDMSARAVIDIARQRGPVLFASRYTEWPQWYGYKYFGKVADGKPNGYARPMGKAGKNQIYGFDGGHAGLLLGSQWERGEELVYVHDPNHRSGSRPETPPYDILTVHQFKVMYDAWAEISQGNVKYACIPMKEFPVR